MAPRIKSLVIEVGSVVKFRGQDHAVKSYQLVTGQQPILTLAPIMPELLQVSLDELDENQDAERQDGD